MRTRKKYTKEFKAVAESFFGSLKQERIHWRQYQTRYEAQQDV